jgi:uncharacterized cofD-like protein
MKAVALGGGHGTAVTLRALRSLTSDLTAVVSVADDGGSTGRLRAELDVAAVGDLRKCLSALADPDNALGAHLEHRFRAGDLEGHALGNLLLAGMIDATGDLEASVRAVATVLGVSGTVLPASCEGVTLVARTDEGRTEGQTEVSASATIRRVATEPASVRAPKGALDAILDADLVVIGPGSLYTSVLAACVVPGITEALAQTSATVVLVANLHEQAPETAGYSLADHISAAARHGVVPDVVIHSTNSLLVRGAPTGRVLDIDVTGRNPRVHDAAKLARCLGDLVA